MRNSRFWLLIIILTGFALRLALLGEQSLWYDEGVTWMLSKMQLPALMQWTADDIQPPLYYLLIWLNDIALRDSEWALRFPSALAGTLTIPLMAVLSRRLFPRRLTALLAAALFSVSPLMVYYSQEARMYTLLTLQAVLASYLLLKILHPRRPHSSSVRPSSFALFYLLTAAAALYTHYFAAFLLTAHALYALLVLIRQKFNRRLMIQLAWAFGGALLLFAPWLPILLARLGDDPSYWPGALKLHEAARKVAVTFAAGETVFEQTGVWLALGFAALLLIAVLWRIAANRQLSDPANRQAGEPEHSSAFSLLSFAFLLLWLLLPPLLILALSYQSPKFNPRYTLLAWPAFALLMAAALTQFHRPLPPAARGWLIARRTLAIAAYGFVLVVFGFSLFNLYADPRFSKDDFQALAQFVRERKAADETVLLSSGHLFPVWAYYAGWDGWTPLPWMLRLDVSRVTDLSIADTIAEAVDGADGVWLVTWQDEVIDPTGVVPFWLDRIGERPHDAGDFWGVGLEHWRLKSDAISSLRENPIRHKLAANFNNRLELVGMAQLNDSELVLFWRPRQSLPDNLVLTFNLTDSDGFGWSKDEVVTRLGSDTYPPSRWPMGQTIITRHTLPWQIGTPPGLYTAQVGVGAVDETSGEFSGWDLLDAQGRPQRRTALADYVNLSRLVQPDGGPLPQDKNPVIDLYPIIGLRRVILPQTSFQPGDSLRLALLWQAGEYNLDDIALAFDLTDSAGETFRVGYALTPSRRFNLPRWNPGEMVLGQYRLAVPPEAAPGPASLAVHIINTGAYDYDEVFPIGSVEILPTERNFTPPDGLDMPLDADFSGQITLLGADCPAGCAAAPGGSVELTLYWRADAPTDTAYTVFTHALSAEETVQINADHAPPKPTTGWVSGEIIRDPVTLTLPATLLPGSYPLEIGLYNAADPAFARLPLADGQTRVLLPNPLQVK